MKFHIREGRKSLLISGLIFLITSCTTQSVVDITAPKALNDLYARKASRMEVMSKVDTTDPNIGVIYDKKDKLVEAFIFLDKIAFEAFTVQIACDWHMAKNVVVYMKKGQCKKDSLKYEFRKDLQLFELKWKK